MLDRLIFCLSDFYLSLLAQASLHTLASVITIGTVLHDGDEDEIDVQCPQKRLALLEPSCLAICTPYTLPVRDKGAECWHRETTQRVRRTIVFRTA